MVDAVKKYAGVDWNEVETLEQAREIAKEHNIEFEERHKKGDILNLFFEEYVEEHLVQPTFVMASDRDLSAYKEETGESGLCRAFRVLYEWLGDGQRLLRAERPDRSERALQSTGRTARSGRRRG